MQVHKDIHNLPSFRNAVITIGTFDGVHTGHNRILNQLKEEAQRIGGETVIITFDPHPRMVVATSTHDIKLLNTLDEKIELLLGKDIDHVVVVPFTEVFSEQTAEEYVENFIVGYFKPHTIIIGYDHHFGKNRKGNYLLLEEYGRKFNFLVKEIPEHIINEITISSTQIRNALLASDVQTANKFLGYSYFFEGRVVKGDQIGRTLGYPTANLEVSEDCKLIPGNGVYAVELSIGKHKTPIGKIASINPKETRYSDDVKAASNILPPTPLSLYLKGMMSIGIRPTIGISKLTIEVHIFDWQQEIYDRTIRIYLRHFIRPEVKFNNLDELKTAIAKDEVISRELLSGS